MSYLENIVGVPFVRFEMFDGYGAPLAFSIAHDRKPPMIANFPDVYAILLEDI